MQHRSFQAIYCLFFLLFLSAFLPALDEIGRKQLDQLWRDHKFLSAWQQVEKMDPQSEDLDAVLFRSKCLLQSMVRPADPTQFFLKDGVIEGLDSGNPIGIDGLSAVRYPLIANLLAFLKQFPESQELWLALGSANYQFSRLAIKGSEQQIGFARDSLGAYQKAIQLGNVEGTTYWRTGILLTLFGDFSQASTVLGLARIKLDRNPELRYDLAYALWLQGDFPAALEMARQARDALKQPESLALARLLIADIQFSMKDITAALASFQDIYGQNPANLYPLRRMIECSLILADNASLEKFTRQYAESLPVNPESLYSLTMLFLQYGTQDVLFATTKVLKTAYAKTRPEVAGLMAFYEAMVYAGTRQSKEALAALDETNQYLGVLYGPDHPISQRIREMYSSLR